MFRQLLKRRKRYMAMLALLMLLIYGLMLIIFAIVGSIGKLDESMFGFATGMTLSGGLCIQFFMGIMNLVNEFNMALSMGRIRKKLIWNMQFMLLLDILLVGVMIAVLLLVEWGGYQIFGSGSADLSFLTEISGGACLAVAGGIVAMVVLEMFCGALFGRFGMRAFWGIWLFLMALAFIPQRIAHSDVLMSRISAVLKQIDWSVAKPVLIAGAVAVAMVMYLIAQKLLRKQEVMA